jgi:cell division septal protein FtsQ
MAIAIGDLGREKRAPFSPRRLFLRPGGTDRALRKSRRRRAFRVPHVLLLLALQAVFFTVLREAYLFLITWEEFDIDRVQVVCGRDNLRRAVETFYEGRRLGNILLCDLEAVRAQVRRLAWVRDASVQKVFPSGLRISIVTRSPFALLERDGLRLADEDGHALERVETPEAYALPVISDETGFASGFFDKWEAARRCLETLPRAEKDRLAGLRTNDYGTLELAFRGDPVRIVVSAEAPAEGLADFRRRRAGWEADFGPLALANLGFGGRVYLRPAEPEAAGEDRPQPDKGD